MNAPVAASLTALTPEWFSEVLTGVGHADSPVLAAAAHPLAITGSVADMARFELTYEHSADDGPRSVIAKIRGGDEFRRAVDGALGMFEREGRFYTELAGHVPLGTPRCFHVGDGNQTPLLIEDLGDQRAGDQLVGLTVADAQITVDALADMHAMFWQSPDIELDWLAAPGAGPYAAMVAQVVASGVPAMRERYAGRVDERVLAAMEALAPDWSAVLAECASGQLTLVHHDSRLDNIFYDQDGAPTFVDWQIPARARGTQDIAQLLATSMGLDLLRDSWEAILQRYHARLIGQGVLGYSWEQCLRDYRQNILYTLGTGIALIGSLAIEDDRDVGDAMVYRSLQHAWDVDAFQTVDALLAK